MKKGLIAAAACLLFACGGKSTESSSSTDSLQTDSIMLADRPAPAALAFGESPGYMIKDKVALPDSVNFMFLTAPELAEKFSADPASVTDQNKPDFVINYVVAVVCQPRAEATQITLDKVEVDGDINVYVVIRRGERQEIPVKATQVFSIERRDGFTAMQFFVNGKKDKALIISGL